MKITYSELFVTIEQTKIKEVIKDGLGYKSENFREIKKSLPKEIKIPGFASTSKIHFKSNKILFEPILKALLYLDDDTARLLFKGYYNKQIKSVGLVSKTLIENGYKIIEPDFINNEYSIETLQDEDIYSTDEANYFRPKGISIKGLEDEDATILATLLGWSMISDDEENEFEIRVDDLNQEYLEISQMLVGIAEDLTNGIIPDDFGKIEEIEILKIKFDELKDELNLANGDNINSIQELKDKYQKIQDEDNLLDELYRKVLDTLTVYKTIYHIKGESLPFFDELNGLAELQKKAISEETVEVDEEWFVQLTEETHLFNYFIDAVELRLEDDYDEDDLDDLLDKLEKECKINKFNFYKVLSRQINRGNFAFKEETSPEPEEPIEVKKGDVSSLEVKENNIEEISTEVEVGEETKEPITELEEESKQDEDIVEDDNIEPEIQDAKYDTKNEVLEESIEKEDDSKIVVPEEEVVEIKKETTFQKESLSNEDLNILKLLEGDQPQLAFHLAKCYENENNKLLLSHYVIENLFLSAEICNSEGAIAEQIALNISNYEPTDLSSNEELAKRLFYFASLLQPVLFAYHTTGAGAIMNEINFEKMPELSELKKFIYDYMYKYGTSINLEIVKRRNDSFEVETEKDTIINEFKAWKKRAQVNRFRSNQGHPYTLVWQDWMKKDGWIGTVLENFFLKKETKEVQKFLKNEIKSVWNKRLNKDIKRFVHGKKMDDQEKANVWLENQISELTGFLNGIVKLFVIEKSRKDSKDPNDVINFVKKMVEKLDVFISNSENKIIDSFYAKVANQYVLKSFLNLKRVLENNTSKIKIESINRTSNSSLLYLDFYECGDIWEPKLYDFLLKTQIESKIDLSTWSQGKMVESHLENFNAEALYKIIQINNEFEEKIDLDSLNREAINRLEFSISTTKVEVEKGFANGYINEETRLEIIALLDGIERSNKSNQEGVNLPLATYKTDLVLKEIEEIRNEQVLKARDLIQVSFKDEEKNKLNELLDDLNLLVFYETLELVKEQRFEVEDEADSHFDLFFNGMLSQKLTKDAKEIMLSLRNRKKVYNIVFAGLPVPQLEEAKKMMDVWFRVKQYPVKSRIHLKFDELYIILDGIGFKEAEIIDFQRKRNLQYFDFNCAPIKDKNRCPIPQFGSIANGKYRLICIWDGPSEEELIDDVKEYTPETYRAVIVFNFCKMTQQRRKDLAKVNRAYKSSFLVLDESLLLYLCGIRGSRLPIFFKLATPFTYVEPYQTASSNLPDEMFYGRIMQIQQLKNATGDISCLIYGGRQLGKTVLQKEVQRIFHSPESNNYSIYIDLRERGIGSHREINQITSVLIEDLRSIPNLIPERIQHNIGIDKLMQKFKIWFDTNKEARILLFLDESDNFLEQDAEMEWKHLLPLKGLMEKTNKRFKVIFSGLHNVRRTNEIPNNPLAHLGNPICIGPMIGNDERIEAKRLIELPLENLGFQFHSKDLVYMILSHANWYPSLIQIICSKLVNVMYSKRNLKVFPQIIKVDEISEALNQCRDQIKEKFALTLKLDPSYDLITNIIALESRNDSEILTNGISLDNLTDQIKYIWPEGFDSSNTKMDVHYFLQEMIDLGILRETKINCYALRTPNIIDLIGTKEQIEENIFVEREMKKEFIPKVSRILYTKDGREQRSPFSASIFYMIKDPKSKVLVLKGSIMSGLGHIEKFLQNRKEINLIRPENITSVKDLESFIENIDKRREKDKDDIILINNQIPFGLEQIEFTKNKIDKKERLNALFLMDPDNIKRIIFRNDKSFERIENQGIKLVNLPIWKDSVMGEWFKETGCINAEISEIVEVTSYWHELIDEYHKNIFQHPERWKELLLDFKNQINADKNKYIQYFGIDSKDSLKILTELIELNGSATRLEYVDYQEICHPESANNYIDYYLNLNIIDNNLNVDKVIQKIILNE